MTPVYVTRVLLDRLKQSFGLFLAHLARLPLGLLPFLRLVLFVGLWWLSLILPLPILVTSLILWILVLLILILAVSIAGLLILLLQLLERTFQVVLVVTLSKDRCGAPA